MAEESLRAVEAGLRLLDLAAAEQRMRRSLAHPPALRLEALARSSASASSSSASNGGAVTTIINNKTCGNSAASSSLADAAQPALDRSSASAEWGAAQRPVEPRDGPAGEAYDPGALPQTTLREPAAVLGARAKHEADALGELLDQRQTCISDVMRLSRAIEQQTLADREARAARPLSDDQRPGLGSSARARSASSDDIARAIWGVSLAEHRRNEALPDWVRVRLDTSSGAHKLILSPPSIL
jgi:hypothetical protein